MSQNRAQQQSQYRGGSISYADHRYRRTDADTGVGPSPIDLHYEIQHRDNWQNEYARDEYDNLIQQRDFSLSQLPEGTQQTQAERHQLEQDIIRQVRGKAHTQASGWEAGIGPQPRKRDQLVIIENERDRAVEQRDNMTIRLDEMMAEQQRLRAEQEHMRAFMTSHFPGYVSPFQGPSSSSQPPPSPPAPPADQ